MNEFSPLEPCRYGVSCIAFTNDDSAQSLGLTGEEEISLRGLSADD